MYICIDKESSVLISDEDMDQDIDFWARNWPGVGFDLNGTLDEYLGWEGKYKDYLLRPGAVDMLRRFKEAGYFNVITTAQPNRRLVEVESFLYSQLGEEMFDLIDMITNRKLPFVTICDRSLTFDGTYTGWVDRVRGFRAWWEGKKDANAPTPEQIRRLGLDKGRTVTGSNKGWGIRPPRFLNVVAAHAVCFVRVAFNKVILFPIKRHRRERR